MICLNMHPTIQMIIRLCSIYGILRTIVAGIYVFSSHLLEICELICGVEFFVTI